jgi:hypothetical protein
MHKVVEASNNPRMPVVVWMVHGEYKREVIGGIHGPLHEGDTYSISYWNNFHDHTRYPDIPTAYAALIKMVG